MLDFIMISTRTRNRVVEIYPRFILKKSSDLMIRGRDFYAIWDEKRERWSTEEQDAIRLIDEELSKYAKEHENELAGQAYRVLYMWDAETRMIETWHKYCQKDMRDNYHILDENLIFSNTETRKENYASKKLSYPLEQCDIPGYERLMSVLYSEEERHKIEWAIGSIVTGDSKYLQKFLVLYGAAGTGKSTVLNIIQKLFEGYYSVFDAKALGSASNSFALEAFRKNPLIAIQHDGDLSKIEDNTRLNSLVSHELMTVNEKFKSTYENSFKTFLFMGTNKPVKITDAKSGLIRRLIDVSPTGEKLSPKEYKSVVKKIDFELGGIACHCRDVYLSDPGFYDDYIPLGMMGASNDFYNYVLDSFTIFKTDDGVSLKSAWEMYRTYCEDANVQYPFSKRIFKEELKNYFWDYEPEKRMSDGSHIRSYYSGFRSEKFGEEIEIKSKEEKDIGWIHFKEQTSIFDEECEDFPAQYATSNETPYEKWENVTKTLKNIDTKKLHYVKVPENHIVIDFDLKNDGTKSLEKNLEEANKWPPTYAELSKSGKGIHLHYIYNGDPSKLSSIYSENIEVKVFLGKSSLRRKLTMCNDLKIASLSSGLPLKEESKTINFDSIKNEQALRTLILKNLNKEYHGATKPSIDFIVKILDDAYNSGMTYDVSDLHNQVLLFAAQSTHNAEYCIKQVAKMRWSSDDPSEQVPYDEQPYVFYDVEVFPNLFLINWKTMSVDGVHRMINPTKEEVEKLIKCKLIGFNCRRYDNHILYGRLMGYSNEQLYDLSKRIIGKEPNAFFGEAYNISFTDIYDFASAGNKKSLKKFEIELKIHHKELGFDWDQPVPEEMWDLVAEYCDNDVIATEAVFTHLKADWVARQILADVAEMSCNDTTNSLTTRIIFGKNKKPQSAFNYRNMGDTSQIARHVRGYDDFTAFDKIGRPIFPGYEYKSGVSTYRGETAGEGGYVYAEPGMYTNVALLDIASMHPSSIIAEQLFGDEFTQNFADIRNARVEIKHKNWDVVRTMLNGKLSKYVDKVLAGELTAKELSTALKTAINAVYGLTAAHFDNPFRDIRNKDNIVAKRGALFMINLKNEVQKRGFTVAHVKTDSIKIPDATPEIIQFVMDYGKMYGYSFEHEATYEKMCLVNNAVYIARYADAEFCKDLYGYIPEENEKNPHEWTATGAQFAIPYVFKTLFSKEDITLDDLCETKEVQTSIYLRDHKTDELQFVGKVGSFCPIDESKGGKELLRQAKDPKTGEIKYDSVTGAKGYDWLEAEDVRESMGIEDIDISYYKTLADDARDEISKYGDFEWFVSDDPVQKVVEDDVPWAA